MAKQNRRPQSARQPARGPSQKKKSVLPAWLILFIAVFIGGMAFIFVSLNSGDPAEDAHFDSGEVAVADPALNASESSGNSESETGGAVIQAVSNPAAQATESASASGSGSVSAGGGHPKLNIKLDLKPFLETYCYECHGPEKEKGDIRYDTMEMAIVDEYSAETWQEVLDTLNAAEMPPKKAKKHPPVADMAAAIDELTRGLMAARKRITDTSAPVIRRLNRREYQNTIVDLLGVRVDAFQLPDDDLYEGFDTVGQAHVMSSHVFEQYLKVGKTVLEKFWAQMPPPKITGKVTSKKKKRSRKTRLTDSARIEPEVATNKNAERRILSGINWVQKGKNKPQEEFKANVKRAAKQLSDGLAFKDVKGADTGLLMTDLFELQVPTAPGQYEVSFRIGMTGKLPAHPSFIKVRHVDSNSQQATFKDEIGSFQLKRGMADAEVITFEIERKTDKRELVTLQLDNAAEKQATIDVRSRRREIDKTLKKLTPKSKLDRSTIVPKKLPPIKSSRVWLDWIEIKRIGGNEKSKQRLAFEKALFDLRQASMQAKVKESEREIIGQVLATFISMACRGRAPASDFKDNLVAYYLDCRLEGMTGQEASIETLSLVLASPSFVYHVEEKQLEADKPKAIDDLELASRLSYTLWGSAPDEAMLALAMDGRLAKEAALHDEVERLLNDPKANEFMNAFTRQWLNLDHLDMVVVNKKFNKYNEAIRHSLKTETLEFIAQLIREDLSVTNIIDSDFVMVNDHLAAYYGLEGAGHTFKKVKLPANSKRGGLLGQGAILTMTGNGERTSPVERGAFVLRKILGTEPPPPPPNVPQLEIDPNQSIRAILAQHAESAQCASCHQRFDSFGLALEHFDTIGMWRDYADPKKAQEAAKARRKNQPLPESMDVSGEMPNGDKFVGHDGLKKYLMSQKDRVARGVMKSMMVYCLGRPVGFSDEAMIDEMMGKWRKKAYGMRSLIHLIVSSSAFQSK